MPYPPIVPSFFFVRLDGSFDREGWESALKKEKARYLVNLKECYERLLEKGEVDEEVTEAYVKSGMVLKGVGDGEGARTDQAGNGSFGGGE